MKKSKFIFLCIALTLLLQSCVPTLKAVPHSINITSQRFAPTDPSKVELFFSKLPNREYEEIASVIMYTRLDLNINRDNFDDLKAAAAKIGANAVIQIKTVPYINGIAIRWK